MSTGERTRLVRKRKVRPYQGRGAIYAWLRAQHAAIVALGSSRPCLWAELVLDMVEDHGPIYAEELNALFPTLCEYTSRHRWLAPMSNGVARATVQGEALRRFAALAAS